MHPSSFHLHPSVLLSETSQAQLARRLGVSAQLVSDWKRGRRTPSPDHVFALEEALDVEPGQLAARAAERGLAAELLRLAVQDFEREHGALTDDELRIAEEHLTAASGVASAA